MPLKQNKFQPYFPDLDGPNNLDCGKEYCWPVQVGDPILAQFYQTPCSENLVCDSSFSDQSYVDVVCNQDFVTANQSCWIVGTTPNQPMPTTYPGCANVWCNISGGGVSHTAGFAFILKQDNIGLNSNLVTRVKFGYSLFAGNLEIQVAWAGTGIGYKKVFDSTNSILGYNYYEDYFILNNNVPDRIAILPGSNPNFGSFDGNIFEFAVRQYQYSCWEINDSWILDIENGWAFHIEGTTGSLVNNTTNYALANNYYQLSVTINSYISGSLDVYISNALVGTISSNGTFTFYGTPTVDGTISFIPTADFIGNVINPQVFQMQNDHSLELIDSNGNSLDVSQYLEYYNEFITINLDLSTLEINDDCYTLELYDQCTMTGQELVIDGQFNNEYAQWQIQNNPLQFTSVVGQVTLGFTPFGYSFTDYVINGDFSSGSSNWALTPGWLVIGGKAIHTPGNTTTLSQPLTLPAPPLPALGYTYYIKFSISSYVGGSIKCKLGNDPTGTEYTWKGNDIFIQSYAPKQSGTVTLFFTPSIDFDGEIGDIAVVMTQGVSAFPYIKNTIQPLFTPGNYQVKWENVKKSNFDASTRAYIAGGSPLPNYQTTETTHSHIMTYPNNGGQVWVVAKFTKSSPLFSQQNLIEGTYTIDNISVKKIEPFEETYKSECIFYSSNPLPKTKLITGYCDQNALGFEFENTSFKLQHRSVIRSFNPEYKKGTNFINSGTGNSRLVYSELEKYWKLDTDFASETFHDCMNSIIICDHVLIGDDASSQKEYSANGEEYTVAWNGDGSFNLAVGSVNLRIKNQGQIFNRHK